MLYCVVQCIEFHEGGRRHQDNVKKQLEQARKRATANAKEKLDIEKTLGAIEHAALAAYQRDLAGGKVKKAKMPVPVTAETEQLLQVQNFLAIEQQKAEKELEKKKIEANAMKTVQELQSKALETAYLAYSSCAPPPPPPAVQGVASWQQCYSPEGYLYYYNTATRGTSF